MVLEPTFRIGLLLQIPFALVAFVLARFLLRVADGLGCLLAPGRELSELVTTGAARAPGPVWVPRVAALAGGHGVRGPPFLIARF
jgi:hypothetical protein